MIKSKKAAVRVDDFSRSPWKLCCGQVVFSCSEKYRQEKVFLLNTGRKREGNQIAIKRTAVIAEHH